MKTYKIKINGMEYSVNINEVKDNIVDVTINDVKYEAEVDGFNINPTRMSAQKSPLRAAEMQGETPVIRKQVAENSSYPFKAPLPGTILELMVKEGDSIKAGQVLLSLEAMKMENNIESDRDGIIEKVNVSVGETVLEGHLLLTIK